MLVHEYLDTSRNERGASPVAKRRKMGNLLALSLLSLLAQRPMYPYEMAQMLRARGKDQNFKINWGSLYTVVANLSKYGFIEESGTVREGRQPERTTYQITDTGRSELRDWLTELLSVPEDEHGGFVVALSEGGILPPDEVIGLLTARLATLDKDNALRQADLRLWTERLPRVSPNSWAEPSAAWTPGGRSTRQGRYRQSSRSWTSWRKGGGTRRRQTQSKTRRHDTTPVHGAVTPRTEVATSPPVPAASEESGDQEAHS
jgi:DNA-binding PadR family transcriptional regulator